MGTCRIAEVVVDVRTRSLNQTFDYLVGEQENPPVQAGQRVFVSFGKQYCQAYVLRVRDIEEDGVARKPILAVLDEKPLLTEEMLALCAWLQGRTVCTALEAIHAVLPAAFKSEYVKQYEAGQASPMFTHPDQLKVWNAIVKGNKSAAQLVGMFGSGALLDLEQWVAAGFVREVLSRRDQVRARHVTVAQSIVTDDHLRAELEARRSRAKRQAEFLELLLRHGSIVLEEHKIQPSQPALQALVEQGIVRLEVVEALRAPAAATLHIDAPDDRTLTSWQARALREIETAVEVKQCREYLIHGVTGSGKTEVYLRAIAACLDAGGGAIVLVPEISLTPQMVARFTSRFGPRVAVLHSGLSQGEKRDEWLRIRRGHARIVVGARSAVFAPVENLRLVIVDEEHEPSYKQEESPRYDAREVARWRAEYAHGVTVYGSATPSLHQMRKTEQGLVQLLTMPQRVNGQPLPPVTVVDMREELRDGNHSLFSRALQSGLEEAVDAGRQAILFLNRRGYASFVLCRSCGETLTCEHCDISLTLHRGRNGEWLKCHYCGSSRSLPQTCPACGEPALRSFGMGTQQIEEAVTAQWPHWRTLRMDVDTTRKKGAHQAAFDVFARGEADVLIGTQMVAKGLDFPNVAFVGVVAADTMLAVPDYRSAERTFSLLTQVAGRAGRADVPGQTVVQTYRPEHFAISAAASHDYGSFYRQERTVREAFGYPPFCELTLFLATHKEVKFAEGAAKRFERELRRRLGSDVTVLPAVPSGIGRIEDQYRFQVVVKYSCWADVKQEVSAAYEIVNQKMRELGGICSLDVNAGRI